MKIADLERLTGGLSTPSKMPGFSYGIPAWKCKIGSLLAKVENSICSECYALKGMYVFPNVKAAQMRRFKAIQSDNWIANMVALIRAKYRNKKGPDRVFRWHDSGDIQDIQHLRKIVRIAKALPDIQFWLPTRERAIVAKYLEEATSFPSNLTVRLSAAMIGKWVQILPGTVGSTVGAGTGFACPAKNQGNKCGDCRACWNPNVKMVDYKLH
jgi:hypothetical protein